MEFSCNFEKPFSKRRITIYIVGGIIFLTALGNFIATCWFSFDNKVSTTMYKGTESTFVRAWGGWTILDGYITYLPYTMAMIILIVLSFWKWWQVNKPKSWLGRNWRWHYVVIAVVAAIFFGFAFEESYNAIIADQGFGTAKLIMEFVLGEEFAIPYFIISMILESTIFSLLVWYIDSRLLSSKDFWTRKVWRQALVMIVFWFYLGLTVGLFKEGMQRPYWYDIHFTDETNSPKAKILAYRPELWDVYLHQDKFNWGWGGPLADKDQLWDKDHLYQPWWLPARGWFSNVSQADKEMWPPQVAFPSGHMETTMVLCLTISVMFYNRKNSKRAELIRNLLTALAFIYILDMAFSLVTTTSHWWSDITFTMSMAPIMYVGAWATVNSILNSINKHHNMNIL